MWNIIQTAAWEIFKNFYQFEALLCTYRRYLTYNLTHVGFSSAQELKFYPQVFRVATQRNLTVPNLTISEADLHHQDKKLHSRGSRNKYKFARVVWHPTLSCWNHIWSKSCSSITGWKIQLSDQQNAFVLTVTVSTLYFSKK